MGAASYLEDLEDRRIEASVLRSASQFEEHQLARLHQGTLAAREEGSTRLVPKLRGTENLRIEINAQGSATAQSAAQLAAELEQALQDLGLQSMLQIDVK